MEGEIDELLMRGYDYAKLFQNCLVSIDHFNVQHKLVAHYLFPNLEERDRDFLAQLRFVNAMYSLYVNNFACNSRDGEEKQTQQAIHSLEQDFMQLKSDSRLEQIKTKLTDLQKALVEKYFESIEFVNCP